MLTNQFYGIHAATSERHRNLYALLATCIYLVVFVALPASLTKFEDNIDGLQGYPSFFLGFALACALPYVLVAILLYRVSPPKLRTGLIYAGLAFLLISIIFGFVYQVDAGVLDLFKFSQPEVLKPTATTVALDVAIVLGCLALAAYLLARYSTPVMNALSILILASLAMTVFSLYSVHERINRKSEEESSQGKNVLFSYSKQGKNVLLVFVDGAMSGYLPDIFRDDPSLPARFAGFTWYSNVVSTGNRTLNGLPAVFGGFDYTVSEINRRPGPSLKEKVSAAYRLYVENFHKQGYQVLYSDPFWFGLERKGDCEYFNELYERKRQGRCIHSIGKQVADKKATVRAGRSTELFFGLAKQYVALSLFKIAPHSLKDKIYSDGQWIGLSYAWKQREDKYLNNFFSLVSLPEFSDTSASRSTFTFITTELTRAPLFVNEENCVPDRSLTATTPRIKELLQRYKDEDTVAIYQTTKCAVQGLAKFMGWLKANGIYDNTMVVLASDHGWLSHNPLLSSLKDSKYQQRYSMFQAFLMVKGFGASAPIKESTEFISNANVPGLICETIGGCFDRTTGKTIRWQPLNHPVLLHETPWQGKSQKKDSFIVEALYQVKGDVTRRESWQELTPPARQTP
jgi:Phosphoglycerol transferase and related proteins, alkaline phosphatase superfamily